MARKKKQLYVKIKEIDWADVLVTPLVFIILSIPILGPCIAISFVNDEYKNSEGHNLWTRIRKVPVQEKKK